MKFGAWGAWFAKLGMFLGVAILVGELLFCCILPILRTLINATAKQMEVIKVPNTQQMITERSLKEYYEGWLNKLNLNEQTLMIVQVTNEDDEEV